MSRPRDPMALARRRKPARIAPANRPSFEAGGPLPLREIVPPLSTYARLVNDSNSYLRAYMLGECSVLVTREHGRWHLSIAHPTRYPTWDEVAEARYRVAPETVVMAMLLPPRDRYINLHENCFQLVEVDDPDTKGGAA